MHSLRKKSYIGEVDEDYKNEEVTLIPYQS